MSTGAGDIATMIYNPATLSAVHGTSAVFGVTGIVTRGHFKSVEGRSIVGPPVSGNSGGDNSASAPLPNLHVGFDVADGWRAGLSVTSNYGLGTHYNGDWVGRYYTLDAKLLSIVAQPTVSWQATPWLALGAGIMMQYVQTHTTAALDFGTIDAVAFSGAFGGIPGASDGKIRTTMSDLGVGFSVGALIEPWTGTRFGISYRSAMTQKLDGDARFSLGGPVGAGIAGATGGFRTTGVSAKLRLPPQIFVGAQQDLGNGLTIYGDVNWLGWSRLKNLKLVFDNPAQPDVLIKLPWKDSYFFALGASYRVTDRLTLRGGMARDLSPAHGIGVTPEIPDGNAWWVSSGVEYRWSDSVVINAALGATFTENVRVDQKATGPGNAFRGDLSGTVGGAGAMFASLQLTTRF